MSCLAELELIDSLTNLSYDNHPDKKHYAQNYFVALISEFAHGSAQLIITAIGMIVFYSEFGQLSVKGGELMTALRHASNEYMRAGMLLASIVCGSRLIWMVNKAGWLDVIQQAPALGTIWIITIVQLPLLRALIGLAVVSAWGYWADMKLTP